jgi:hypothetical protein
VTTPIVGLVFECGPQGADKQVCEYLAKAIRPGVELRSKTLDNKANLLSNAGEVVAQLLKDGCTCVLIVWDLRPFWPDAKESCRHAESVALKKTLADAGVLESDPVHLVCIEQELESWLLTNKRAINEYLSTRTYPCNKAVRVRKPDQVPQPKAKMKNYFKEARGWAYEGTVHAIQVLKATELDLKRMRSSESFARFEKKLQDCS